MKPGDLIMIKEEYMVESKKRKPVFFLGKVNREYGEIMLEEYIIMNFDGEKGRLPKVIIDKCEVIQTLDENKNLDENTKKIIKNFESNNKV